MNAIGRLVGIGVVLSLAVPAVAAEDDAHDKLVYGRYSRKVQPSKIEYPEYGTAEVKLPALDHPATKHDVEAGKAIFTFEGLGESRLWKLPKSAMFATWPNLKDFPSKNNLKETWYDIHGYAWQAEELRVDGQWKRYFGFVCRHGVAVVPADEIELSYGEDATRVSYNKLNGGLDWGVKPPDDDGQEGEYVMKRLKPTDALPVIVYLRNRRGTDLDAPTDLYRDAAHGGPALVNGVRLEMRYAPFNPRRFSYPEDEDLKPVARKRDTHFAPGTAPQRRLKTGESFKAFTLDLHDWFQIDKPGHYIFQFDFDERQMGLTKEAPAARLHGFTTYLFNVGDEPRKLTIAELNEEIGVLGGPENQARLVKLIKDTVALTPVAPRDDQPDPDTLLPWSAPVNGLTARIEYVERGGYAGFVVLVRMKNVSDHPLIVPTGNPRDEKLPRPFELHTIRTGQPWQRSAWFPGEKFDGPSGNTESLKWGTSSDGTGNRRDRLDVTLQPNESCLTYLCGYEDRTGNSGVASQAARFKIVLRRPAPAANGHWVGVLETAEQPTWMSSLLFESLRYRLPFPDYFPDLSPYGYTGPNGPLSEPEIQSLKNSNWALMTALGQYEPRATSRELERRMIAEKKLPMKLLLAALAAERGGEQAALLLYESMKKVDSETVENTIEALTKVLAYQSDDPHDWIVQLAKEVITDQRYMTFKDESTEPHQRICSFPGDLIRYLGYVKHPTVVPFLIDLANRSDGIGPVMSALGESGDVRAIPTLLEFLKKAAQHVKYDDGWGITQEFEEPMHALTKLKAKQAVPVLLEHVEFPDVIEALEAIGDARALPALRELVAANGTIIRAGEEIYPKLQQKRLFAARLAVVVLGDADPIPGLLKLLDDESLDEYDRRTVVWRLGDRRDLRAVPDLINAVKAGKSGAVVNQAVTVLAVFKSKAAVDGLIECFDANFEGKGDWKRAYNPDMFRANIAESLRAITGQSIGPDKQQWLDWWQANRDKSDLP